jgi:hypothetical protein
MRRAVACSLWTVTETQKLWERLQIPQVTKLAEKFRRSRNEAADERSLTTCQKLLKYQPKGKEFYQDLLTMEQLGSTSQNITLSSTVRYLRFWQRSLWSVLIFWYMTPCSLIKAHGNSGQTYDLHFQARRVKWESKQQSQHQLFLFPAATLSVARKWHLRSIMQPLIKVNHIYRRTGSQCFKD